jgi:hypothetical protein
MTRRNRRTVVTRTVVTRWFVGTLVAVCAYAAALNEVVSLNRFAGDHLNFPDGLEWTLPAVVTVATLAGALMWTVLEDLDLRDAGRRLNIVFATISSVAVALDHMSAAVSWWKITAFAGGALLPATATWMTHMLARLTLPASAKETGDDVADEPDVPVEPEPVPALGYAGAHLLPPPVDGFVGDGTELSADVLNFPPPPEPDTEPGPKPATPDEPAEQLTKQQVVKAYLREHGLDAGWSQQLGAEIKVSKPTFSKAKAELRRELAEAVSA